MFTFQGLKIMTEKSLETRSQTVHVNHLLEWAIYVDSKLNMHLRGLLKYKVSHFL